jgi:arylsulfate sulfotransferase
VEFRLDEAWGTVEQLWSYGEERPEIYSPVVGDADEPPQTGNIVAVFGATLTEVEGEPGARVLALTHTEPAEVVFEIEVGDNNPDGPAHFGVYRATHVPGLGD